MLNPVESGLLIEERRRRICELLLEEGRVTVEGLASRFGTSQVTIRADLSALESAGALTRTHGGALPREEASDEPLDVKQLQHHAEKVRIAQAAVALIRDGETIILDSGTTTLEIARQIKNKQGLQVITNGVNIAAELLDAREVQTFIVGGTLRVDSASIVGRSTEEMFEQFSADKLFLSGAGCDPDFGVSGANLEETMVNRAMLRIAREIILVADASKFSKRSMVRIAPFSEIDTVISDTGLREEMQEKVRGMGCNLILA